MLLLLAPSAEAASGGVQAMANRVQSLAEAKQAQALLKMGVKQVSQQAPHNGIQALLSKLRPAGVAKASIGVFAITNVAKNVRNGAAGPPAALAPSPPLLSHTLSTAVSEGKTSFTRGQSKAAAWMASGGRTLGSGMSHISGGIRAVFFQASSVVGSAGNALARGSLYTAGVFHAVLSTSLSRTASAVVTSGSAIASGSVHAVRGALTALSKGWSHTASLMGSRGTAQGRGVAHGTRSIHSALAASWSGVAKLADRSRSIIFQGTMRIGALAITGSATVSRLSVKAVATAAGGIAAVLTAPWLPKAILGTVAAFLIEQLIVRLIQHRIDSRNESLVGVEPDHSLPQFYRYILGFIVVMSAFAMLGAAAKAMNKKKKKRRSSRTSAAAEDGPRFGSTPTTPMVLEGEGGSPPVLGSNQKYSSPIRRRDTGSVTRYAVLACYIAALFGLVAFIYA